MKVFSIILLFLFLINNPKYRNLEGNSWIEFFESNNIAVLYALGIGIPSAIGAALSIFKLYKLKRSQTGLNCRWSVGQSCLTCHLIASARKLKNLQQITIVLVIIQGLCTVMIALPFLESNWHYFSTTDLRHN
jgi:hypothetical protein